MKRVIMGRTHAYLFPKEGSTSLESRPTLEAGGLGFRLALDSSTAILRGNSWDGLAPFEARTGMTMTARTDNYLGFRLVREDT